MHLFAFFGSWCQSVTHWGIVLIVVGQTCSSMGFVAWTLADKYIQCYITITSSASAFKASFRCKYQEDASWFCMVVLFLIVFFEWRNEFVSSCPCVTFCFFICFYGDEEHRDTQQGSPNSFCSVGLFAEEQQHNGKKKQSIFIINFSLFSFWTCCSISDKHRRLFCNNWAFLFVFLDKVLPL